MQRLACCQDIAFAGDGSAGSDNASTGSTRSDGSTADTSGAGPVTPTAASAAADSSANTVAVFVTVTGAITGLLTALLPWLMRGGAGPAGTGEGRVTAILFCAGGIAGLVYWLGAGRFAGRGPVTMRAAPRRR